ncbi:hypothetical protein FRB96_006950 [Tulasnella sp. 330]|nr:hypothetical protein FRB96_006950 [Tulasnella sp. 330]KAG8873338.1 hypothetical protein FRB97_006824 [Tulasnella sp. 331]KAG8889829.1 hypothetical protein FRB98_002478 [Tulasnella sp. 332]
MGSIFSAIGGAIMAVISAIANVLMAIVGGITAVLVAIWNFLLDIICCRCGRTRGGRMGTGRGAGTGTATTTTRGGRFGRRNRRY